jgi:hypothetical protein
VLDELFDLVSECLTRDVALRLAAVRASPEVQSRLHTLAEKCSDGTITADECRAYQSYLRAVNFIGVLQANARAIWPG